MAPWSAFGRVISRTAKAPLMPTDASLLAKCYTSNLAYEGILKLLSLFLDQLVLGSARRHLSDVSANISTSSSAFCEMIWSRLACSGPASRRDCSST